MRYLDDPECFPAECDENLCPLKTQKKTEEEEADETGYDVKEAIDATVNEEGAEKEEEQVASSGSSMCRVCGHETNQIALENEGAYPHRYDDVLCFSCGPSTQCDVCSEDVPIAWQCGVCYDYARTIPMLSCARCLDRHFEDYRHHRRYNRRAHEAFAQMFAQMRTRGKRPKRS